LVSYVWPDQHERLATLRAALEVAALVPARVERARATEWLARRLAEPATADVATVAFHSIVWQYLADDERPLVRRTIEGAGGARHAGRAARVAPPRAVGGRQVRRATARVLAGRRRSAARDGGVSRPAVALARLKA